MSDLLHFEEPKSRRFRDKRTGEIVTQFNIFDIHHMEELDRAPVKKLRRPKKGAPFSEFLQYNVDRYNNRR